MGTRAKGRILFVEDDADIRELVTSVLEDEGFHVDAAAAAEEGLDLLRRRGSGYAAVLTDYRLTGNTGAWMLDRAQAEGVLPAVPTLILTGHPRPELLRVQARIVSKPLDLDTFLAALEAELAAARAARRIAITAA